jgi:hypothetical protein
MFDLILVALVVAYCVGLVLVVVRALRYVAGPLREKLGNRLGIEIRIETYSIRNSAVRGLTKISRREKWVTDAPVGWGMSLLLEYFPSAAVTALVAAYMAAGALVLGIFFRLVHG